MSTNRTTPMVYHSMYVYVYIRVYIYKFLSTYAYRSVKHHSLRLMVFGDGKTGKTTLIERLRRPRHRAGRPPLLKHNGVNIKQWSYAPSSSRNAVKFTFWEFDNQVNYLNDSLLVSYYPLGCL